jgi:glycosyltransferase involved in cell wall biosynthesis
VQGVADVSEARDPLVSVVMSVHNGERFLQAAIESILQQTLDRIELIVIDDGSSDGSPGILAGIDDPRFRTRRQEHAGLAAALNAGIREARADLVARMDCDDESEPRRLERQLEYLRDHPAVGLLGTAGTLVDEADVEVGEWRPPGDDASIRRTMIRRNQFMHPSVMLRKSVFEAVGGYREDMPRAQDYDLWLRMLAHTRGANLPEPLLRRRLGPSQFGTAAETLQIRWGLFARFGALRRGDFPWRDATGLVRPAIAAMTPGPLRQWLRRRLPGTSEVAVRIGTDADD